MIANMHGMTVDGRWVPMIVEDQGFAGGVGGGGAPSASPLANGWSYAAASGGIADTSDVALKAAAGLGRYNYITSLNLMNADVAVATEVVVKDGASTVLFRTYLPMLAASTAPVPVSFKFDPPLVGSNNTALNIACITTSAMVYANAQGFVGGAPNQVALNTNTGIEVYDLLGNLVTDISGSTIYLAN
jgi:hypothetical protein